MEGRERSCIGYKELARVIIEVAGSPAGRADAAAPPDGGPEHRRAVRSAHSRLRRKIAGWWAQPAKEVARKSSAPPVGMVGGTTSEAGDPAASMMTKTCASRLMQEFLRVPRQCPRRQPLRRPAQTINDHWGKIR